MALAVDGLSLSSTAIVLKLSREGANQNGRRTVVFLSAAVSGHCRHPDVSPLTSAGGERRLVRDSSCQSVIFVAAEQHSAALPGWQQACW